MAILTSRALASGVTGNDLIHIVIPSDVSQNPAGSSYKANMGQVLTYISNNLSGSTFTGGTVSGATNFTGGLSANTISATTYYNLPGSGSGNCFTDFYVDNIYGCPDVITFHDSYQSVDSNSLGLMSRSFGSYNNSYGDYSHSEGSGTTTISEYSHAEGYNTQSGFKGFSGVSANTVGVGVITLTGGTDYTSEFPFPGTLLLINTLGGVFSAKKATYFNTNYSAPNFDIYINEVEFAGQPISAIVDFQNLNSVSANTVFGHYSHSEGFLNIALGDYSHSEGGDRKSLTPNYSIGEGSHSEGTVTKAYGNSSHSEGYQTETYGDYSHSEGIQTKSYGDGSHSEGRQTKSYGIGSHSEGRLTFSYGLYSHSEGFQTRAGWAGFQTTDITSGLVTLNSSYGNVTSAFLGGILIIDNNTFNTYNPLNVSFSSGTNTQILLDDTTITIGVVTVADLYDLDNPNANIFRGVLTHSEGSESIAINDYSHAEGEETKSFGQSSHSEGSNTISYGDYSHSEGQDTESHGKGSHSEGDNTRSYGDGSHSEGYNTTAYTSNSHAEGYETISIGNSSHSEGYQTKSYGNYSHSEGGATYAGTKAFYITGVTSGVVRLDGVYNDVTSEFVGPGNVITDFGVFSFSTSTFSSGTYTEIILDDTSIINGNYIIDLSNLNSSFADIRSGALSHSEGVNTISFGSASHSEGQNTIAVGNHSHAEGYGTKTFAESSHSEGYETTSIGLYSHAQGESSIASGRTSHVGGYNNNAGADYSFIGGGSGNTIFSGSRFSSILGGINNTISNASGGSVGINNINNLYSMIGSGEGNFIHHYASYATILGGVNNKISGDSSTSNFTAILNGSGNTINDEFGTENNEFAFISNGLRNKINTLNASGENSHSFILNGIDNEIRQSKNSIILNGVENLITRGENNLIFGGNNTISGTSASNSKYTSVFGFENDVYVSNYCAVFGGNNILGSGGQYNFIMSNQSEISEGSIYSGIFGGALNKINLDSNYSSIIAGESNVITGNSTNSVIIGGYNNTINNGIGDRGIVIIGASGITGTTQYTTYVNDFVIKKLASKPTSSGDTVGEVGSITWDDDYFYVKTMSGWGRTQLSYSF